MKKLIIAMLAVALALSATEASAQTWSEWFKQKKTQKKYLLRQIAALKVYADYAQKGYKIAQQGLTTIGGFTRGEFSLHGDYFNSLKTVNPEIRGYAKVDEIILMQARMLQDYHTSFQNISSGSALREEEINYLNRVFGRLMDDCEKTLDELITVIADGKLEMTDDERMQRIDLLYYDMQGKYTFLKSFTNEAKILSRARFREQKDVLRSRALHGINDEP
jgi:hypothetical protein